MPSAVIRIQNLEGTWEVIGRDRLKGITPEGVQLSANAWGSDTCRFNLKRNPRTVHPDLSSFTPAEVEVDGRTVWSGRIWETPTKEGGADSTISVEGRGWQYHLDDDAYQKIFVHTRMSEWTDVRSSPLADLAKYVSAPTVDTSGTIQLNWSMNSTMTTSTYAGVYLDLGPDNLAKRIIVDFSPYANNDAGDFLYAYAYVDEKGATSDSGSGNGGSIALSGATGILDVTFSTAYRFVTLFYYRSGATINPTTTEHAVRINSVQLFTSTAYESGRASILTADTVIKDAIPHAMLLTQDTSRVSATTFQIPEFYFTDDKTPREAIDAINTYHNYRTRVDVDKVLRFDPFPTQPIYEAGAWQGVEFEDASANSGETIYNRCAVTGTGPDGRPKRIVRSAGSLPNVQLQPLTTPSFLNPSFATDVLNWTATGSGTTFTRITTPGAAVDSSPASAQWSLATTLTGPQTRRPARLQTALSGTFQAGITYVITFRLRNSAGSLIHDSEMGIGPTGDPGFPDLTQSVTGALNVFGNSTFVTHSLVWTPRITTSTALFWLAATNYGTTVAQDIQIDTFQVNKALPTMVDRRGFVRTMLFPLNSSITDEAGAQVADAFLQNHRTASLRGGAAVGPGGLRAYGSGDAIHPALLLANVGELIRFNDRVDPDTGAVGRDGRIASVNYDLDSGIASVAIDNERRNFEAMLSRFSILSSSPPAR
jgi:hypothetical protein